MAGLELKTRYGGVFYAFGTIAGQRVRQSLKTRDEQRALELKAQLEARIWKRHSYGEEAVRTFEEAALSYQEAGGERRFLAPLIKAFQGRVLGSITPEEIRRAARTIYPRGSGATRNRQGIVPARCVINHGASLGWCHKIAVKNFPTAKPRRVAVGREWINAFLAQADADGLAHLAAAVLFMWQTAARVSETARVLPEHVNLTERIVFLETTKTDEWEECHITRELMLRIAKLPQIEEEPLFGYASRFGIYRRMKAVCRRAGIQFVPPHQAGRHSYATNAIAMRSNVREVMDGGRWKSARLVLETYAKSERAGRSIADRFDDAIDTNLTLSDAEKSQTTDRKAK